MGFNIAGLLINKKLDQEKLEAALETKLTLLDDVDFEEATSSSKDENAIDVLESESGTLVLLPLGQLYDSTTFPTGSEVIQFMVSDVSDTYYFEKYSNGELVRKLILTEGEIAEDYGEAEITEEDDFTDKIWEFSDAYLQNDFIDNMLEFTFKRYQAG